MQRIRLLGTTAVLLAVALLGAANLTLGGGARSIVLKLSLPQEDTKVLVNGKETAGTGTKRDVVYKLPAGTEKVTVTAKWEPNNYTKITRKRTMVVGEQNEIALDLRKASAQEKDDIVVRFVPTPDDVVDEMCEMARIGKNDIVYDLGCGDGRMVIRAVQKFGAKRGVGIDLDPVRVKESKEAAKKAGVEDRVTFRQGDVLKVADLADATVVMLYMGDDINLRLRPILQKTLKPGARIVSHRFTMGDWEPVQKKTVDSSVGYPCDVLLWQIKGKK